MNGPPWRTNRRQALLATAGSFLTATAGCLESTNPDEPPDDATVSVEISEVEPFAPDHPLEAKIDVVQPSATPEHPPEIEITLANDSISVYQLLAGEGEWQVLSDRISDRVDPGVALFGEDHEERFSTPDVSDGCWEFTESTNNPLKVKKGMFFDPNGAISLTFEVWGHRENADEICLPAGEFTFSESYTVEHDGDETAFDWAFSLRIESIW